MKREIAESIIAAQSQRHPVALLTWLESGEQEIVFRGQERSSTELDQAMDNAFRLDKSSVVPSDRGEIFIQIFNPGLRLIVIGAVHAAQFLAPMADMLGYDLTIIDPREAFASKDRFPNANLITEWPEDGLPQVGIDERTAIIALTHDAKIDDIAIKMGLEEGAFYVGALGSKRTHAQRLNRLKALGIPESEIARIRAPIGLDIGSQGPAEIAISILAEIVAVLRGKAPMN